MIYNRSSLPGSTPRIFPPRVVLGKYTTHEAKGVGGWETTRNGCLQRQRVALWSIGAAQEHHRSAPSCQRQVKRPLALPVKRLHIALNAPVMRLVTTPLELKDLIGQIADAHDAHCPFSNVRPIRPNKRTACTCRRTDCMYIQTHYNTNHPTWALPQTN